MLLRDLDCSGLSINFIKQFLEREKRDRKPGSERSCEYVSVEYSQEFPGSQDQSISGASEKLEYFLKSRFSQYPNCLFL